jgi:hypothetical protein
LIPQHNSLVTGSETIVNLNAENIDPTKTFFLSEDTHAGLDMYDDGYIFQFDPNSDQMATAIRWGAADTGSTQAVGVLPFNIQVADLKQTADDVTDAVTPRSLAVAAHVEKASKGLLGANLPYEGTVKWASKLNNKETLAVALRAIFMSLVAGMYTVTYAVDADNTATFSFGPKGSEGVEGGKVKQDWRLAVAMAERWGAIDAGLIGV